jgi:hypothetical protein
VKKYLEQLRNYQSSKNDDAQWNYTIAMLADSDAMLASYCLAAVHTLRQDSSSSHCFLQQTH